jgi:hypothetical protein
VLGLVLAFYWAVLPTGFFYLDDFAFAEVARSQGLFRSLMEPHVEHLLPLYRAQFWLLYHWGGGGAWVFSLCSLVSLAFALHALLLLLARSGVAGPWRLCFLAAGLFWPRWGDWFQGYFCLTFYVQNVGFFAWGLMALLGSNREPRLVWAALLAALFAMGNDISGVWVPAAFALFLGVDLFRPKEERLGAGLRWLLVFALLPLAGVAVDALVVPERAGSVVEGSHQLIYGRGVPSLFSFATMSYAVSLPLDVWASMVTPAWLPAALPWKPVVAVTLAVVLAAAVAGGIRAARTDRAGARVLLFLAGALLVFTGLVVATRKNDAGLWQVHPTQHIGTMLLLGAAAAVAGLDLLTRGRKSAALLPWAACLGLVGAMNSHAVNFPALEWEYDRQELPYWGTRTLPDGMHAAARRRTFCAELIALHGRLREYAGTESPLRYPELPGRYLEEREPAMSDASLTMVLAVTRFKEPVVLFRSGWERGWNVGGEVVSDVAAETPSWFREALKDPEVVEFYGHAVLLGALSEGKLAPAEVMPLFPAPERAAEGRVPLVSQPGLALEGRHGLVLESQGEGEGRVRFRGKGWDGWHEARLAMPPKGAVLRVSLRESVAFNLLEEVTEVEVWLPGA